jgi:hypothetical protein
VSAEVADDLSAIRALRSRRGPRCGVCTILAIGDPAIADKLTRALADQTIQSKSIQRWLNQQGIDIGYDPVRRHRRGDCRGR